MCGGGVHCHYNKTSLSEMSSSFPISSSDDPTSRVHGNLVEGVFDGSIHSDGEVYQVEPASRWGGGGGGRRGGWEGRFEGGREGKGVSYMYM